MVNGKRGDDLRSVVDHRAMVATVSLIDFRFVVANFLNEALNGIVLIGHAGMFVDEFNVYVRNQFTIDRFFMDVTASG